MSIFFAYFGSMAGRFPAISNLLPCGQAENNYHYSTGERILVNDCDRIKKNQEISYKIHDFRGEKMAKISINKEKVEEFCRENRIRRLALFGSVLRDDFGPESDVDVLVEFEPGSAPGFFGLARMESQFSSLFNGRKVDMRTPEDLSRYFRKEVEEEAEFQYAQK